MLQTIDVEDDIVYYRNEWKAKYYREIGNKLYKDEDYFKALNYYNMSIAFAESSKEKSLAYANRSAVYLENGLYKECLNNISLAKYNYPKDKLVKLEIREEKCKEKMKEKRNKRDVDPWDFFKLSYTANKRIPWIVDCLEMRQTEKYGRGIYATKDLKVGDIISVVKPEICFLNNNISWSLCANCFKTNTMNLIPDLELASMMYCSYDCLDQFRRKLLSKNAHICGDMCFLKEIAYLFGGLDKFNSFADSTDLKSLNKTIFDYDFSNLDDPDYNKNIAMCLLSLNAINPGPVNEKSIAIRDFVSKTTRDHIINVSASNVIHCLRPDSEFIGISTFNSLINHSCENNASQFLVDNKLVTLINRPVKAGDQIFFNYYGIMTKRTEEILEEMEDQYHFKCDCCLCTDPNRKPIMMKQVSTQYLVGKDYNKIRKELMKGWRIANTVSCEDPSFNTYRSRSYCILRTIGNSCFFPTMI